MQVASWLPRTELPFAAPSRLELLQPPVAEPEPRPPSRPWPRSRLHRSSSGQPWRRPSNRPRHRARVSPCRSRSPWSRPTALARRLPPSPPRPSSRRRASPAAAARAGNVLLVVELPTGESFQSRDPAYILLRTCCAPPGCRTSRSRSVTANRSAGRCCTGAALTRVPRLRARLRAGRDGCRAGADGLRLHLADRSPCPSFAGEVDVDNCYREVAVEGLGRALAMPGLEA